MKIHFGILFIQLCLIANCQCCKYYQTLGLKENASLEDVKMAFRKLSIRFHPDKSPENYEKYLQIIDAYEIITDSGKKPTQSEFQTTKKQQQQNLFSGYFNYIIQYAKLKIEQQEKEKEQVIIFLASILILMVFLALKIKN